MVGNKKLIDLINQEEKELVKLDYSPHSVRQYVFYCRQFLVYSGEHGREVYDEVLAASFLKERYNYPGESGSQPKSSCYAAKALCRLGELNKFGKFSEGKSFVPLPIPEKFLQSIKIYEDYCKKRNLIDYSIEINKRKLNCFFTHLTKSGIDRPHAITPTIISGYVATLDCYAKRTYGHIASVLRGYFKALYFAEYLPHNLAESIPGSRKPKEDNISAVWRSEDLEKILAAIDKGSSLGKRDFAVLMIARTYGIRAGDIRALQLNDFDWNNNIIRFVQSKTRKPVSLPLIKEVGEAVIDYLKYGRPKTGSSIVFVKHCAPYDGMNSIGYIFTKYQKLAGIICDEDWMHGINTLRHTLASDLLEKSVSIEVIAGILGHTTTASSQRYLHLDFKNLRRCSLEVDYVTSN